VDKQRETRFERAREEATRTGKARDRGREREEEREAQRRLMSGMKAERSKVATKDIGGDALSGP
jgi:hypothetical protein